MGYSQRKTRRFFRHFCTGSQGSFENSQDFGLLPARIPARRHGVKIRTESSERSFWHPNEEAPLRRAPSDALLREASGLYQAGRYHEALARFEAARRGRRQSPDAAPGSARPGQHRRLPVRPAPVSAGPTVFPGSAPPGGGRQRPQRCRNFRRQHRIPLLGTRRTGRGVRVDPRHDSNVSTPRTGASYRRS